MPEQRAHRKRCRCNQILQVNAVGKPWFLPSFRECCIVSHDGWNEGYLHKVVGGKNSRSCKEHSGDLRSIPPFGEKRQHKRLDECLGKTANIHHPKIFSLTFLWSVAHLII